MPEKPRDDRAVAIGQRIIQARKEAGGMKARELAELLDVSERSMQAYESGEVVPYRHLRDLERILGRPMAWFLYGDEAMAVPETETLKELRRLSEKVDQLAEMLQKPKRR